MSGTRKRRVASTTTKAHDTIAVAASESKDNEDAAEKPLCKCGRPPKKKDKKDDGLQDAPEDSDDQEEAVEEGKEGGIVIDWTKDLTWTLITGIEENEDIRRGLFPPPGSSKRNGGGFPKKHFQFMLARICFENHPDYSEAFKKCLTGSLKQQAKLQKTWFGKIKNRLKVVTASARASIEMMGQTGAGLESADEILPDTPLQTKWDKIKEDSPWFWHMRSLIGEHPNLRPVGIGNNGDNMDTSLLIPNADDDDVTHPSSPGDTLDFPERLADVGTDTDNDLYTMDHHYLGE
ncbi:hypothetical protein B0H10DRAFT_2220072 [Mycena sp. CBHHK59/15]|nr:hypothetical protein B0H10DRAFT_2220072 [Mycena sp. CBHHK59/15]